MPKLNTTIDNLEWRSNKIVSSSIPAPADWTDEQYPSLKTLLDIAHPVKSILTTSENVNPSTTLGGTWNLVDKAFRGKYIQLTSSMWTPKTANLVVENSSVILIDHMISMRLNFTTTAELNDNTQDLGTLNLAACGITALSHAVMFDPIISDSGNCTAAFMMNSNGDITIHEVLKVDGTHTMATGSNFYINILQTIGHDKMPDASCDKFYWERIA